MSTKPVSSKTCKGECIQPVVIEANDDEEICVDTPEVNSELYFVQQRSILDNVLCDGLAI